MDGNRPTFHGMLKIFPQLRNRWHWLAAIALLAGMPFTGRAAINSFLSLSGLPGTSVTSGHTDGMDILEFEFGMLHPAGAADPKFSVLWLNKKLDAASPLLAQRCAAGSYLPGGVLTVNNPGGQQVYQIKFDNVWINSVLVTNDGVDTNVFERVGLVFDKVTWTYTQYNGGGGSNNVQTAYDSLYGKAPIVLTINGKKIQSTKTMDLTWNARAGATYNVYSGTQVDHITQLYTTLTTTNFGPNTLTVPAGFPIFFYRLQEIP